MFAVLGKIEFEVVGSPEAAGGARRADGVLMIAGISVRSRAVLSELGLVVQVIHPGPPAGGLAVVPELSQELWYSRAEIRQHHSKNIWQRSTPTRVSTSKAVQARSHEELTTCLQY